MLRVRIAYAMIAAMRLELRAVSAAAVVLVGAGVIGGVAFASSGPAPKPEPVLVEQVADEATPEVTPSASESPSATPTVTPSATPSATTSVAQRRAAEPAQEPEQTPEVTVSSQPKQTGKQGYVDEGGILRAPTDMPLPPMPPRSPDDAPPRAEPVAGPPSLEQ